MDTIAAKPPLLPRGPSPSSRRKKVHRASPVTKRRHSSPPVHPVRRSQTFDSSTSTRYRRVEDRREISSSDDDSGTDIDNDKTPTNMEPTENNENNSARECLCRKRSVSAKDVRTTNELMDRRENYRANRRSLSYNMHRGDTEPRCQCRTHRGALKPCTCSGRRLTKTANISESELMENETRLVVLEFLRGTLFDELKSSGRRTEGSVSSRISTDDILEEDETLESPVLEHQSGEQMLHADTMKRDERRERGSTKYNTVTIGEYDHQELLKMLASTRDMNSEMTSIGPSRLGRSRSDVSAEHLAATREKIQKLQKPVKQWIETNSTIHVKLKSDIVNFDKGGLKKPPEEKPPEEDKKTNLMTRKNLKSLSLKIPPHILPSAVPQERPEDIDLDILSPETFAVNRLELISQDIMKMFPELLEMPISKLIGITEESELVNYDRFSKIAKPVFDLKVPKSTSVWSRVALVLYMVRETVFLGNLNDRQLELLVEHSTKFFTDNAKESVEKEGGWESAIVEDMFFANGIPFDDEFQVSSDDDKIDGPVVCPLHPEDKAGIVTQEESLPKVTSRKRISSDTFNEWSTYGIAILTVGLGLAYSYLRS